VPKNVWDIINGRLEGKIKMDFESAKKQFKRLSRLFQAGQINQDEFIKGVDDLAIDDDRGIEWQIGMQSGRWYRKQGENWIEDDPEAGNNIIDPPPSTRKKKIIRRWLLMGFLALLAVLLLLGPKGFGSGDLLGLGDQGLPKNMFSEESSGGLQTNLATSTQNDLQEGGGADFMTSELPSLTPTTSPVISPTVTAVNTAQPSSVPTLPPPPPRVPPQVWDQYSKLDLEAGEITMGDWVSLTEMSLEYEYLRYQGRQVLLLQFSEQSALWPSEETEFEDVDRAVTLAFPRNEGYLSLVCRWNPQTQSGFALQLSQQTWELAKIENGFETILANGSQSTEFKNGAFGNFRLTCIGEKFTVWSGNKQIAEVVDDRFSRGLYGLVFGINNEVGLVYLAEDRVLTRLEQGITAGRNQIVRLGTLDVQYLSSPSEYAQMLSGPFSGQPLIGMRLRISNYVNEAVQIRVENIYLEKGDQRIYVLSDPPLGVSDNNPLILPFSQNFGEKTGEIFFVGVSLDQLKEWQLVVDLSYQGFGEARFRLNE
jgi:hypothetical protein